MGHRTTHCMLRQSMRMRIRRLSCANSAVPCNTELKCVHHNIFCKELLMLLLQDNTFGTTGLSWNYGVGFSGPPCS